MPTPPPRPSSSTWPNLPWLLHVGPTSYTFHLLISCFYTLQNSLYFTSPYMPLHYFSPATESLHCNLSLVGPNERGILRATHNCSRPVTSLCQVSRLPATSCEHLFEFNTSPLGPGTHAFVLVAEDGFGESIMKVFPFFIETGQQNEKLVTLTTTLSLDSSIGLQDSNFDSARNFRHVYCLNFMFKAFSCGSFKNFCCADSKFSFCVMIVSLCVYVCVCSPEEVLSTDSVQLHNHLSGERSVGAPTSQCQSWKLLPQRGVQVSLQFHLYSSEQKLIF